MKPVRYGFPELEEFGEVILNLSKIGLAVDFSLTRSRGGRTLRLPGRTPVGGVTVMKHETVKTNMVPAHEKGVSRLGRGWVSRLVTVAEMSPELRASVRTRGRRFARLSAVKTRVVMVPAMVEARARWQWLVTMTTWNEAARAALVAGSRPV